MNADLVYLSKIEHQTEQQNEISNDTQNSLLNEIIKNINDGNYNTISIPKGKYLTK